MSSCKCFPCPRRKRSNQGAHPAPPSSHSTRVPTVLTSVPDAGQRTQESPRSRATAAVAGSLSLSGPQTAIPRNSLDRRPRPSGENARSLPSNGASASGAERSADVAERSTIFKRTASAELALKGTERYDLHFLNEEQFYADVEQNNVKFPVDIVAVHGFGGHPFRSWTPKKGRPQMLWLRDFLPGELPGSRIFSFGYQAERVSLARGTMETFATSLLTKLQVKRAEPDTANRSIIFIAHSMGGLVVKQAFVTAKFDEANFGDIVKSVKGIFFLGTPHDGADGTKYLQSLATTANYLKGPAAWSRGSLRTDLMQPMQRNSQELSDLAANFRNLYTGVQIVSCLEMEPFTIARTVSIFIVDKATGRMNVREEMVLYMNGCDHEQISRFESSMDPNYQDVLFWLKKIIMDSTKRSQEQEALLATLNFKTRNYRENEVKNACPGTGEWLFRHPLYLEWTQNQRLGRHECVLWLRGKPGSGKSTLMKHAVLHARGLQPRPLVLSFYFHGRGVEIEKSSEGFFRSLLFQILSTSPEWPREFLQEFRHHNRMPSWYANRLSHFLGLALSHPPLQPPKSRIYIFIDALDECHSEESFDEILRFLEDLTQATSRPGNRLPLRICVSKRNFPNLLDQALEIKVEKHNGKDIETYVQRTLRCVPKYQRLSRDTLLEQAEGVFQWVYLVIKDLNRTPRNPQSEDEVINLLKTYPKTLGELYDMIIRKLSINCLAAAQCLFQWLLFDDHPFTPAELAYAMAFNHPFASLQECHNSSRFFGEDEFERRVTLLSCGLIEFAHSSRPRLFPFAAHGSNPPLSLWTHGRVQLIHESVRDWLLDTQANGLLRPAPRSERINFESWKQESPQVRKSACVKYLNTTELESAAPLLRTPGKLRTKGWLEDMEKLFTRYVLLHYAVLTVYGIDCVPFANYPVNLAENPWAQITITIPAKTAVRIDWIGDFAAYASAQR